MWCLGLRGYWRLGIHKFELLLAVGTTLRLCSDLFMTPLTYFQVLMMVGTLSVDRCCFGEGNVQFFFGYMYINIYESKLVVTR